MIAENAVIPIEQIEGERRAGSEVREAVIEACPRFRPIMLAPPSTVVALIPIAPIALGGDGLCRYEGSPRRFATDALGPADRLRTRA